MTQKVLNFIREQQMLTGGEKILVGLSGGADSVALLHFLLSIRSRYSLELTAVHVNHGIRPDAGRDEAFCVRLCEKLGLPIECRRIGEGELARMEGRSLEEAARIARYELLEQCRRAYDCDKIAVAHHANDNAETMLFQLFRGSSLRGLAGIPPVRGHIIRPFLCVSRDEIRRYLEDNGLEHVEDGSNQEMSYTRNQIRACVIPLAEAICGGAVEQMNRCAGQLREIQEYVDGQAVGFLERNAIFYEDGAVLPLGELKALPTALLREVLMECTARVSGSRKDLSFIHVENMRALLDKDGQKECSLPYGLVARKSYDEFKIYVMKAAEAREGSCNEAAEAREGSCFETVGAQEKSCFEIPAEGEIRLPDGGRMTFRRLSAEKISEKFKKIPQNDCTKWFDCDKIRDHLQLRHRRPGDILTVREDGGKKRLQDYLINEKIPREQRDALWLLADGSHILWVVGHRISMEYKITGKTENILEVHWEEKENGGES